MTKWEKLKRQDQQTILLLTHLESESIVSIQEAIQWIAKYGVAWDEFEKEPILVEDVEMILDYICEVCGEDDWEWNIDEDLECKSCGNICLDNKARMIIKARRKVSE